MDTLLCRRMRHYGGHSCRTIMEWIVICLCIGLVLSAEAVNSAIEALADRVSPAYDEAIKRTKDLAAGAVLLLAIASAVVGLIIFLPKLTLLS